MKKTMTRITALIGLLTLLCCMASCQSDLAGPYVSAPQDSMLIFIKDGKTWLSNMTSNACTEVGEQGDYMNKTAVAMASGSAYFIRDGALYYKSYMELEQKVRDNVTSVFYAVGSVFALTGDGVLIRTGEDYSHEEVLTGITQGAENPPFLECDSNAYVAAEGGVYRLLMGDNPSLILKCEGEVTFLTVDEKSVYFAADGAVWRMKHKGLKPEKLSEGKVTPLKLDGRTSYRSEIYWVTEEGELVAYSTENQKTATLMTGLSDPQGRLLPQGASRVEALTLTDGGKTYACLLSDHKIVSLPEADWVYAVDGVLYGFAEGKLLRAEKGQLTEEESAPHHTLSTPDGYYYLTGSEEGYEADLWYLDAAGAHRAAEKVCGSASPRAVYKYGGVSYYTADSIYLMDEETHQSDLFASCTDVADFVPRKGGALLLLKNGDLELMTYSDSRSTTLAQGVEAVADFLYCPERLRTYPLG